MTTFPADSNASAVILSDVGEAYFDSRGRIVYERHRRIKILTEGGYDWGTVEITYHAEDDMERVVDIDGQTFTVSESGEVIRHELDGDDVFEEEVNDAVERKRFTLPALEPGAVIEYRYKMRKENPILMPEWTFQASEPTLWSEYTVEIPDLFTYVQLIIGAPEFQIREQGAVHSPLGLARELRWAMKDVPALREEPFMTALKDYRARVALQLKSYRTARGAEKQFMSTWADVAEELLDHDDFGDQLDAGGDVRTRAELLVSDVSDPHAKMTAIYDYVRTKVEWNGKTGVFADRDVDDVLEAQSGSSQEIALLLAAMLRNVDVEAHPVLLSTRDHGKMQPVYPYLSQFNRAVVYVNTDEEVFLLDATDPHRGHRLLPERALNEVAWMVTEGGDDWLQIGARPYQRNAAVIGQLHADGRIEADVKIADADYSALQRRRQLQEQGEDEFARGVILDGLSDVEVQSTTIQNVSNVDEALTSNVAFQAAAYAQRAGQFLYINPTILDRQDENPLRAPTRSFAVDFAYPRDLKLTVSLQLPDGYAVEDMPSNKQVKLPGQAAHFQRLVGVTDGRLTMRMRFLIRETRFEPDQYESLRGFFEEVVAAQAEQVVLRRTEAAEDATAGGSGR